MAGSSGLVYLLRRRIAVKLTVTLVAFVGMAAVVGGLYLDQALETFAVESLEARLATVGRLLLADERVTLITADGRVVADSDVAMEEWASVENHAARPEVREALEGRVGRGLR